MNRNQRRTGQRIALLLGAALLGNGSTQALGDFGFGIMGGFNYVPSPGDFLNQRALMNVGRGGRPPSNNVYANSSNAYFNNIRDNGFVPSYDVARRVPPASRADTRVAPVERTAAQTPARQGITVARPVVPIATFFTPDHQLTWPSDAPVEGELQQKRDISDFGCRQVLFEHQVHGRATIGAVTDSRLKLLAYGQPALQMIRANATPRVADTFHLFMLSLYESLAQAANPANPP